MKTLDAIEQAKYRAYEAASKERTRRWEFYLAHDGDTAARLAYHKAEDEAVRAFAAWSTSIEIMGALAAEGVYV